MQTEEMNERYGLRVANLLKEARQQSGLSARELARRVGTSHPAVLAYESGKKVPMVTTMMRLLHACGFSIDFVLSPRLRGDDSYPKGDELEDVLNLAGQFPARHDKTPDASLPI